MVFLSAVIVNLVHSKFLKSGLAVSILGVVGFVLGAGYSVLYFITDGGKAVQLAADENLRMTFTIGRFAFYGFAVMALAGGLIPALIGGFF